MELSFSIRQLVVYIYSLRGDIGKAIDEARQMYEKAETMRYDLGIALFERSYRRCLFLLQYARRSH